MKKCLGNAIAAIMCFAMVVAYVPAPAIAAYANETTTAANEASAALEESAAVTLATTETSAADMSATDAEDPVVMTYIGSDGITYEITKSNIEKNMDDRKVLLSKVFAEAGIPDTALAECAYEFITSTGQDQLVRASLYNTNIFFYKYNDGNYWAMQYDYIVFYVNSAVTTIKAVSHDYDVSTHKCVNQVYLSGKSTSSTIVNTDCGAVEPDPTIMTYVGSDGKSYKIGQSVFDNNLDQDSKVKLSTVFTAAGIPTTALAECAYEFTSASEEKIAVNATQYNDLIFDQSSSDVYPVATSDFNVYYTSAGVKTIKALSHAYDESTNKCTNKIYASGDASSTIETKECNAQNPDPLVMTYVGSDGTTYKITKQDIDNGLVNDKVALSTVFTAAEIPTTALAECAYEFGNSDSQKQLVRASEYNSNICLYKWSDGVYYARNAYSDAFETVLYTTDAITTIKAVSHVYDESTHKCTNSVYASGTQPLIENEACGAEEAPAITYVDSDGISYPIYDSNITSVEPYYIGSLKYYELSKIFAAAEISDEALAECSYELTNARGGNVIIRAAQYANLAITKGEDGCCYVTIFNNTIEVNVSTIKALSHAYDSSTHKCTNQVSKSNGSAGIVTEACDADESERVAIIYKGSDGKSYSITYSAIEGIIDASNEAYFSEVITAVGIPEDALADCAYEFICANGEDQSVCAASYSNLCFCKSAVGAYYVLLENGEDTHTITLNKVKTIKALSHTYDSSTHKCTNQFYSSGDATSSIATEVCGAEDPVVITYTGSDGKDYVITKSVIEGSLGSVNEETTLAALFKKANIPDFALADCAYEFTSTNDKKVNVSAKQFEDLVLVKNSAYEDYPVKIKYWLTEYGVKTIKALSHVYDSKTYLCTNEVYKSGDYKTLVTEACGVYDSAAKEAAAAKELARRSATGYKEVAGKSAARATYKITSATKLTVQYVKTASKAKSVTVPATVKLSNGKTYKVTSIGAKAFGKKAKTVTIKTKKLTKKTIKKALKSSKVKTVKVKVGSNSANKKFVKKYKKIFTKKIAGKKVVVK